MRPAPSFISHRTDNRAARPPSGTPLGLALLVVSVADVLTTAVALSWGHAELSPVGAVAIATAGVLGMVALKLLAMAVVWVLRYGWPFVGQAVGWGLAWITTSAVVWNLHVLGRAPLPL